MSIIIFDIGGTGARCAAAGLFTLTAAERAAERFPKLGNKVIHWHIDKDDTNGTGKRSRDVIKSYGNMAASLGSDFKAYSVSYEQWNINDAADNPNASLQAVFTAGGNKRLLDTLFSTDDQKRQLSNGFEQRPALGSIYFERIKEKLDDELSLVLGEANSSETIAVFIMGSAFGGSGASMIHNLARYVRKYADDNGWGNVKIGGTMLLPYFEIPPLKDSERRDRKAKGKFVLTTDELTTAAQKALYYYGNMDGFVGEMREEETVGHFDAFYPIGMHPLCNNIAPNASNLTPAHFRDGKSIQESAFSITDLIAAQALCDFLQRANDDTLAPEKDLRNIFIATLGRYPFRVIEWNNLPDSEALKKRLLAMTKFALFVTTFVYPEFRAKLDVKDKKGLKDNWYAARFDGNYQGTEQTLYRVFDFCLEYLKFIQEVAGTVKNGKVPMCELFDVASLNSVIASLELFINTKTTDDQRNKQYNGIRDAAGADDGGLFNDQSGGLLKKAAKAKVPSTVAYSFESVRTAVENAMPKPKAMKRKENRATELFRVIFEQCAILTEEESK